MGSNDCLNLSVDECKTQCVLADSCSGIIISVDGDCCARSDIDLSQCDDSNQWDTWVLLTKARTTTGQCWLHSTLTIAQCETHEETYDTYVRDPTPSSAWWLTSHFIERTVMPRRYKCDPSSASSCTLQQLQGLLPSLKDEGYSVINIDWPVSAGPDRLFLGFGIYEPRQVDPRLGDDADWEAFVDAAHGLGMKVIADFNPSYFWTGAPAFQHAVTDVKQFGLFALPAGSPAHWFRWAPSCPGAGEQPPDDEPSNGWTDSWVHSSEAGACYWSVWGGDDTPPYWGGQPTADLTKPEWRAELTSILTHWVVERKIDGFLIDAPPDLLAGPGAVDEQGHDQETARYIRETIVDPVHSLGGVVFGEIYNLQRPTVAKMMDGGRNTDMDEYGAAGAADFKITTYRGFPSQLHDMVAASDASGLEALLSRTVDVWSGWTGTARTQPHRSGLPEVAALKAAVTALLAGYYYQRYGPDCHVPSDSFYGPDYGTSPPGNEWPGGCFGSTAAASLVAVTLKALSGSSALTPAASRRRINLLSTSGCRGCAYAALRERGGASVAAVVLFNFAATEVTLTLEPLAPYGIVGLESSDLLHGGSGPPLDPQQPWVLTLQPLGWAAYGVAWDGTTAPSTPSPPSSSPPTPQQVSS